MTKRKAIKPETYRVLYARSGNKCAFPSCCTPIFEDNNQLTGECCHIEAYSEGGPRFNASLSDDDKNSYDNLILMCSRHHKIIDGNPDDYPVEYLKSIKASHEEKYMESTLKLNNSMLNQLMESTQQYWRDIKYIHDNDTTGLHRESSTDMSISQIITILEETINNLEEIFDFHIQSDESLYKDFKQLCEKLGYSTSLIDTIPYYENPFANRNWEINYLERPNNFKTLRMYFYALTIKILEITAATDFSIFPLLNKWRQKFFEFQKNNYCFD